MSDQHQISIELAKSEIAGYNFYHIRWLVFVDAIGFVILLFAAYQSVYNPNPEFRNNIVIFLFWGTLFLAVGLSQPFILFLQIFVLKSPAVEDQMQPKSYTFNDSGIHIESGLRTATTSWSKVVAIKDIGKLLLIYTSPKLAYVIPKRYFSSLEEKQRFIGYLINKIKESS
jgi:hypothetical protein